MFLKNTLISGAIARQCVFWLHRARDSAKQHMAKEQRGAVWGLALEVLEGTNSSKVEPI